MKFAYIVDEKDIEEYAQYISLSEESQSETRDIPALLKTLLLIVVLVVLAFIIEIPFLRMVALLLSVVFIIAVLLPKRHKKENGTFPFALLGGSREIHLDQDGITIKQENIETRYQWLAIRSVEIHKGYMYITTKNVQFHILPLEKIDESDEVKEYIMKMTKGIASEERSNKSL